MARKITCKKERDEESDVGLKARHCFPSSARSKKQEERSVDEKKNFSFIHRVLSGIVKS